MLRSDDFTIHTILCRPVRAATLSIIYQICHTEVGTQLEGGASPDIDPPHYQIVIQNRAQLEAAVILTPSLMCSCLSNWVPL